MKSFHFILIEDSKLDTFIAKIMIESLGDLCLSFHSFLDPLIAFDYIRNRSLLPEKTIVFLDIQMPLLTGFEFVQLYSESLSEAQKSNFIINILSSSINEKDIIQAKSYPEVDSFLNKPLSKEMILEQIKKY